MDGVIQWYNVNHSSRCTLKKQWDGEMRTVCWSAHLISSGFTASFVYWTNMVVSFLCHLPIMVIARRRVYQGQPPTKTYTKESI